MNYTQKSPERAFALQKYLLLHSQHDALQKHLTQISTSSSSSSQSPDRNHHRHRHSSTSTSTSTSSSPSRSRQSSLSSSPESSTPSPFSATSHHQNRHHQRSGSIPVLSSPARPRMVKRRSSMPTLLDESIIGEIQEEEGKLKNVNEQIKCTLTDLLNCESVRADDRYRRWVQTRLMDAERELKGEKARCCDRRRESDGGAW